MRRHCGHMDEVSCRMLPLILRCAGYPAEQTWRLGIGKASEALFPCPLKIGMSGQGPFRSHYSCIQAFLNLQRNKLINWQGNRLGPASRKWFSSSYLDSGTFKAFVWLEVLKLSGCLLCVQKHSSSSSTDLHAFVAHRKLFQILRTMRLCSLVLCFLLLFPR